MDSFAWLKQRAVFFFLSYLRFFSRLKLDQIKPIIVGITGSAGKSSAMYACDAILKEHFKVKISLKANSESGIPLNILGIEPKDFSALDWFRMALLCPIKLLTNHERYDVYIVEMGIDSPKPPKNMGYLLKIVSPKIAVFLNALPVHGEYFDHLVPGQITTELERREAITDYIAAEKAKLIESLPPDGWAILNVDDERVKLWKTRTKARVITVSSRGYAQIQEKSFSINNSGISMEVKEGKKSVSLSLKQFLDESYVTTLLCAIGVGRALGISLENCVRALETNLHTPPGRMNLIPGIKQSTIIDSSYNASRQTMMNALELLCQIAKGRKVAVLGDMRELGEIARIEHEQVAEVAKQCADVIVVVGSLMHDYFVPKLHSLGFPDANCKSVMNPFEAAQIIKKIIKRGDTILVKGSQNTLFLEIVVEELMLDKRDADRLLCRRGIFWDKKREALKSSYLRAS